MCIKLVLIQQRETERMPPRIMENNVWISINYGILPQVVDLYIIRDLYVRVK